MLEVSPQFSPLHRLGKIVGIWVSARREPWPQSVSTAWRFPITHIGPNGFETSLTHERLERTECWTKITWCITWCKHYLALYIWAKSLPLLYYESHQFTTITAPHLGFNSYVPGSVLNRAESLLYYQTTGARFLPAVTKRAVPLYRSKRTFCRLRRTDTSVESILNISARIQTKSLGVNNERHTGSGDRPRRYVEEMIRGYDSGD